MSKISTLITQPFFQLGFNQESIKLALYCEDLSHTNTTDWLRLIFQYYWAPHRHAY